MTSSTLIASLGWAAGFVDGEGCIHLARVQRTCGNRINYRLRLSVSQNCLVTLEHLRGLLGGTSYLTKVRRKLQHNKQIYTLIYAGATRTTRSRHCRRTWCARGWKRRSRWTSTPTANPNCTQAPTELRKRSGTFVEAAMTSCAG